LAACCAAIEAGGAKGRRPAKAEEVAEKVEYTDWDDWELEYPESGELHEAPVMTSREVS
jgi:hypothetical protein